MPKVSLLVPVLEPGPLIEPLIAPLLFQTMPAADDPAAPVFPRVKGSVRIDPEDAAGGAALPPGRYDVLVRTSIAGFAAETVARVGDTSFTITVTPDGRVTSSPRAGDAVRHASRRDRVKARIARAVRGRGHT